MSKIPDTDVRFRVDPDLRSFWENRVKEYSGKKLDAALDAILKVKGSGFVGSWDQLTARYDEAITAAVK